MGWWWPSSSSFIWSRTLAGNLLIVGSIANIIVVQAAERRGIRIAWLTHPRIGVPVTLGTLAVAGGVLLFLNDAATTRRPLNIVVVVVIVIELENDPAEAPRGP